MQPRPQVPKGEPLEMIDGKKGDFNPSGGNMIYIWIVVIALVASFGVNYMFGVSKSGVEKFQADTKASVDSLASDIKASKDSIKMALDGVPTTVSAKVEVSLGSISARLNTMEADIKAMKDSVASVVKDSSGFTTKLDANIGNLTTQINSLKTDVSTLKTSVGSIDLTSLTTKTTSLEAQLVTIKNDVATLQNQYSLTTIAINTGSIAYPLTTGIALNIPVSVTNTGLTNISVPLKLVLTTGGTVVVSSATMDRVSTVNITGTTITYYVIITVPASSTITMNQLVTITYTGTSPNTWTAVWSKQ